MNKDDIINQLERIYANLVALGTYYFHEHCEYSNKYGATDDIDTVEFGLWDAELRIKEVIKLLEGSHGASGTSTASSGFRDARNFNDKEPWETSKWTYDAGVAMAFQDCGTEKASSKVSQEAAAQEAIRRY
jgi:hypothetical protein